MAATGLVMISRVQPSINLSVNLASSPVRYYYSKDLIYWPEMWDIACHHETDPYLKRPWLVNYTHSVELRNFPWKDWTRSQEYASIHTPKDSTYRPELQNIFDITFFENVKLFSTSMLYKRMQRTCNTGTTCLNPCVLSCSRDMLAQCLFDDNQSRESQVLIWPWAVLTHWLLIKHVLFCGVG